MRHLTFLPLLWALAQVPAETSPAALTDKDWLELRHAFFVSQSRQPRDLAREAAAPFDPEAAEPRQVLARFDLMLMFGLEDEAIRLLQVLEAKPPGLSPSLFQPLFNRCFLEETNNPRVARALLDLFAGTVDNLDMTHRVLPWFKASGWTAEELDVWLADKPAGQGRFWVKTRLLFARQEGRLDALLNERLRELAEVEPSFENTLLLLEDWRSLGTDATSHAGALEALLVRLPSLRPTQADTLAESLGELGLPALALRFDALALEGEPTAEELKPLALRGYAFHMDADELRRWYRQRVLERQGMHRDPAGQGDASRQTPPEPIGEPKAETPTPVVAPIKADPTEDREAAYTASLEAGDLAGAETIFPELIGDVHPSILPAWHGKLALAAARQGKPEEALRLWKHTQALAPEELRGLAELAQAGLGPELRRLYESWAEVLPNATLPRRALERLR